MIKILHLLDSGDDYMYVWICKNPWKYLPKLGVFYFILIKSQ